VAARFLIRYAALSQRDVAVLLKAGSGSAICKQLVRLDVKLDADRGLRRLVKQAQERLDSARRSQRNKTTAIRSPVKSILKG